MNEWNRLRMIVVLRETESERAQMSLPAKLLLALELGMHRHGSEKGEKEQRPSAKLLRNVVAY